jgi:indolepyruvate ferredoxin oxidoreductase alpha subunit
MNAVHQGARFILVILDNSTTAMTGGQPTFAKPDNGKKPEIDLKEVVRSCGVEWIEEIDPYEVPLMIQKLKEAESLTRMERGGVAVILSKHPCLIYGEKAKKPNRPRMVIQGCKECGLCTDRFDCPAIAREGKQPKLLDDYCTGCGTCVYVCPTGSIGKEEEQRCS